jgi:hypothetical protein
MSATTWTTRCPKCNSCLSQNKAGKLCAHCQAEADDIPPGSITITVPIPPKQMHPNSRNHWRAKLGAKAEQRGTAKLSALEALNGKSPPRWERATIHATFYRSSPRAKQQDGLNLLAWLKATEDGIEDAQIVANDRGVTWLAPSQVLGKAAQGRNEVVIVITKIEPTAAAG